MVWTEIYQVGETGSLTLRVTENHATVEFFCACPVDAECLHAMPGEVGELEVAITPAQAAFIRHVVENTPI